MMRCVLVMICFFSLLAGQAQFTANFTASDTAGCYPLSITFSNTTSGSVSQQWDFGNGSQSTLFGPTAVFTAPGTYLVTLVTTNGTTIDSAQQQVTVYDQPIADFTFTLAGSCESVNLVDFQSTSVNADSLFWDFGDGVSSLEMNPHTTYTAPGSYYVSLLVKSAHGCTDLKNSTVPIVIQPNPVANFTVSNTVVCGLDSTFNFNNGSTGAAMHHWYFGDGNESFLPNPTHQYAIHGEHDIMLISTSAAGCTDTLLKESYVKTLVAPSTQFNVSQLSGCAPVSVNFQSLQPGGYQAIWNYGDGSPSDTLNTGAHTYGIPGTYSVSLQMKLPNGCRADTLVNALITVYDTPSAQFTVSDSMGCAPLEVEFVAPSGSYTYTWDFGDGTTSNLQNPDHIYNGGQFLPSLEITDANGCTDHYESLVINAQSLNLSGTRNFNGGCAPTAASFGAMGASLYYWDFGDGNTANVASTNHTYTANGTYFPMLIGYNNAGCSDTIVLDAVYIGPDVTGLGISDTLFGCLPGQASFTFNGIGENNWLWDFGDGTTSTLQNADHTYSTPGTYEVSLSTQTLDGCNLHVQPIYVVHVEAFNPVIDWELTGCSPISLQVVDSTTNASEWYWQFGDGDTSFLQNPTHIYDLPNVYLVSLNTVSNTGCSAQTLIPINAICTGSGVPGTGSVPTNPSGAPYVIDYSMIYPNVVNCAPALFQMVSPFFNHQSWYWDFGDGYSDSAQMAYHSYSATGTYDILHTAIDSVGHVDSLWVSNVSVFGLSSSEFTHSMGFVCDMPEVSYASMMPASLDHEWTFGDGAVDSILNPVHLFPSGNHLYYTSLTVRDGYGCERTRINPILIQEQELSFNYDSLICPGEVVTFSHNIPTGYDLTWDFGDGTTSGSFLPTHIYAVPGSYTVYVELTDSAGCVQQLQLPYNVTVFVPNASFTALNSTVSCDELLVNFAAANSNADSYLWQFTATDSGSGSYSSFYYNQPGTYDVSLTVTEQGCVNTVVHSQLVTVNQAIADIQLTPNQLCYPFTVAYEDVGGTATSWNWLFPNGAQPTGFMYSQTYVHNYETGGNVFLTVTDTNGCTGTDVAVVPSGLKMWPTASSLSGCAPHTVTFKDYWTSNATSGWYWDFGDGTTSTDSIAVHTYLDAGTYTVSLVRQGVGGCSDTAIYVDWIEVAYPVADFSITSVVDCSPVLAEMTNLSSGAVNYQWDFGDGSTSTVTHPTHVYGTPGIYYPQLRVYHPLGCSDTLISPVPVIVQGPNVDFTWADTLGCDELFVSFDNLTTGATTYEWNFGNGEVSVDSDPSFLYEDPGYYDITLIAEDANGCVEFVTYPDLIHVVESPTAIVSIPDPIGCAPANIAFMNSSSGYITSSWDFGDASYSNLDEPTHSYPLAGSYDVVLTVTGAEGCADTTTIQVNLSDSVDASILPVSTLCTAYEPITLSAINGGGMWAGTGVSDATSGIFDPALSGAGLFEVSYTIAGACGGSDTVLIEVLQTQDASISPQTPLCDNWLPVNLTAIGSGGVWSGTGIADAVNGTFDPALAGAGAHPVVYEISGLCGDADTLVVTVNEQPVAQILSKLTNSCAPAVLEMEAINNTVSGSSYNWYNNSVHLAATPNIILGVGAGTHQFDLVVTSPAGCIDSTLSDIIEVLDPAPLQAPEIIRSTVLNNESVYTEWSDSLNYTGQLNHYLLFKSTDQVTYDYTITLQPWETGYLDYDVNVQEENYTYYLVAVNHCGTVSDNSLISSSILLNNSGMYDGETDLIWTGYEEWDTGVDYYEVQVLDEYGNWQTVVITEDTQVQITVE